MTTKEIINLDCRFEENKEIIQKVLRKIKPLSKYSDEYDIPFEAIEKVITVMCKKYKMRLKHVSPDMWSNDSYTIWGAMLLSEVDYKVIDMVYGISLYEVFAKSAIRLYTEVKKGIKTRK